MIIMCMIIDVYHIIGSEIKLSNAKSVIVAWFGEQDPPFNELMTTTIFNNNFIVISIKGYKLD